MSFGVSFLAFAYLRTYIRRAKLGCSKNDLGAVWWRWMMFLLDCDESQHDDGRTPAFPCCTFHLFSG